MRRERSLVTKREGSPNYYENFTVKGHRFRRSLETNDRETAEILAAKIRSDALLGKLTGKKPEHTLTQALARYWLEHGQHLRSASDVKRLGRVLQDGLGKNALLSEITVSDLTTYAARRRARLSNRSVNIEIEHLRAVIGRARSLWRVNTPELDWQSILLEEPGEREHVLSEEEERRLFEALRPDFHPMVRFALVTGARSSNVIGLAWRQIDWDAGTIVFRVKSKKPGGELHYLPITRTVAAILSSERGHHPENVFTYVCARNRRDPRTKTLQRRGDCYPFTHDGWRKEWKRALAEANIQDFRYHDLRHSAGTRALRAHRNLKAVQHMLGHNHIQTTLRYTRSDVEDVRAAMEAVEKAQPRHTAEVRSKKDKNAQQLKPVRAPAPKAGALPG
jgi:integrase